MDKFAELVWTEGGKGIAVVNDVMATSNYDYLLAGVLGLVVLWALWRGRVHKKELRRQKEELLRKEKKIVRLERGEEMSRPEQERYEKIIIADAVEEVLLTIEVDGKMSRERANHWRRLFANILDNDQLLSKHNKTLKQMLKDRIRGEVKPLPIPEPETIRTGDNVIQAESRFKSKFLQRKTHAA